MQGAIKPGYLANHCPIIFLTIVPFGRFVFDMAVHFENALKEFVRQSVVKKNQVSLMRGAGFRQPSPWWAQRLRCRRCQRASVPWSPTPPNRFLCFGSAHITILPVQPKRKPESLDDLLANAEHYAEFCMRNSGKMAPTLFLIGADGPLMFVPSSLADDNEKDDFATTSRLPACNLS